MIFHVCPTEKLKGHQEKSVHNKLKQMGGTS